MTQSKTTKYKVLKRLPPRAYPKPNFYLYLGKNVDEMNEKSLRFAVKRLMDVVVGNHV